MSFHMPCTVGTAQCHGTVKVYGANRSTTQIEARVVCYGCWALILEEEEC